MFADQCSDPVGVISTISRMHCSGLQACQEVSGKLVVVGFARREREPDRQPVAAAQSATVEGVIVAHPCYPPNSPWALVIDAAQFIETSGAYHRES